MSWINVKLLFKFFSKNDKNATFCKPVGGKNCMEIILTWIWISGTHLVGNVGRRQGSIWIILLVSYLCYPVHYYIEDKYKWMAGMSAVSYYAFASFSSEWRLKRKQNYSKGRRIAVFSVCVLIYVSLWLSYLYFNATIDVTGQEIRLPKVIKALWPSVKVSLIIFLGNQIHDG